MYSAIVGTYVCIHLILYSGNDTIHVSDIYTHINLTTLRRECGDLDELLISAKDIEFNEILGEGILIIYSIC